MTLKENNGFSLELLELMKKKIANKEENDKNNAEFFTKLASYEGVNPDIINIPDAKGNNLLHHAINEGKTEIIAYLASKVKDINAKNLAGATAVRLAIATPYHVSEHAIYHLIKHGADVNMPVPPLARNAEEQTPLNFVLERVAYGTGRSLELDYVKRVIENWTIEKNITDYNFAPKIQDHIATIIILQNPEIVGKFEKLFELLEQGNLAEIKEILTKEPDLITKNLLKTSLLEEVISNAKIEKAQQVEIVKIMTEVLLTNKEKIKEDEKIILLCALNKAITVEKSDEEITKIIELLVKTLVDAKINTNNYNLVKKPLSGNTYEFFLSRLQHPLLAAKDKLLLRRLMIIFDENGFDIQNLVNLPDPYGNTPLHWAVKTTGDHEIISWFIYFGAKLNSKNNNHKTPADLLYDKLIEILGNKDSVDKLIENCRKTSDKFVLFTKSTEISRNGNSKEACERTEAHSLDANENLGRIYIKMRESEKDTGNADQKAKSDEISNNTQNTKTIKNNDNQANSNNRNNTKKDSKDIEDTKDTENTKDTKDTKDTENVKKSSSKFEMIKDIIKRVINDISEFCKKIFGWIIGKSTFTNSENKKGNTSLTISSPTRDSSNSINNSQKGF